MAVSRSPLNSAWPPIAVTQAPIALSVSAAGTLRPRRHCSHVRGADELDLGVGQSGPQRLQAVRRNAAVAQIDVGQLLQAVQLGQRPRW